MTTEYAIDALRSAVRALEGAQFTDVGRTLDMVELGFVRGSESVRLHVQCPFRLMRGDQIVLATADMRYPVNRHGDRNAAFDARTTQFDRIAAILVESVLAGTAHAVTRAEVGAGGAVRLECGDDLLAQIFPDVSGPIECWRLFVKGSDDHYVYRARP
ncbi:hypothetical protein [Dactylosporangium sp. NPDC049140]|uniref:hypothetical protein n=1 Tax=Dactylosporangium sp. NPDC049140 TaxID=3155647 RepID=UPI0033D07780